MDWIDCRSNSQQPSSQSQTQNACNLMTLVLHILSNSSNPYLSISLANSCCLLYIPFLFSTCHCISCHLFVASCSLLLLISVYLIRAGIHPIINWWMINHADQYVLQLAQWSQDVCPSSAACRLLLAVCFPLPAARLSLPVVGMSITRLWDRPVHGPCTGIQATDTRRCHRWYVTVCVSAMTQN